MDRRHATSVDLQTRRSSPIGTSGGFTLIELIAIMVVIAILAVAAAPSLSSMGGNRNTMAARRLLRDVTFAQQRAIATGTRSWVVFNSAAETWSILAEDPANPGRSNATVLNDLATGRPFTQTLGTDSFVGVEIVSASFDGGAEVGFDWLGRPLNNAETNLAAQGTVTLTGSHQVRVEPGTGHVSHVKP